MDIARLALTCVLLDTTEVIPKKMLELTRVPNNYILTFEDGKYILCVSIDRSGFREVNYQLNAGEIYSYESQKESFLNLLAQQIRDNPEGFGKIAE